jgi:transcriptional regulator with XRE-family HTH domain
MVEKTNKHQEFADRLNAEMSKRNLAVKDLSQACEVTYEMARRYTLGTAKPRDEKLSKIADWLGVDPAWLDYGSGSSDPVPPPERSMPIHPDYVGEDDPQEFASLSELEKRLIRTYRKFPDVEARNMVLAFEMRYKQLYDFYTTYANQPKK